MRRKKYIWKPYQRGGIERTDDWRSCIMTRWSFSTFAKGFVSPNKYENTQSTAWKTGSMPSEDSRKSGTNAGLLLLI